MEHPKDSPSISIALDLKRKQPEFDSGRAFKMARSNNETGMPICSCHYGCSHCCSRQSTAVKNHLNFLRSMTPRRIMFYSGGEWSDFPEVVTSLLVKAFLDRKSAVEISINKICYLFDFLSMVLINLESGGQRSVSWIDESEKCFFPAIFLDEDCFPIGSSNDQCTTNMDVKVPARTTDSPGAQDPCKEGNASVKAPGGSGCNGAPAVKTEVIEGAASDNGVSPISSNQATSIYALSSELVKLKRDSMDFIAVMRAFLLGLSNFADSTSVMGIYRYTPKNSCSLARRKNFEQQILSTRSHRGHANVRYGWFGTSREGVFQILLHGFGRGTKVKVSEGSAYGTGFYLMPANCSSASVKYCDVDENGAHYMLLCRVVMGNMEKVPVGSKQYLPSSPEFDSGVDDLLQSKCYVVWGAHMTTHIHPEFIICFKLSPTVGENLAGLKDVKGNSNMATRNQKNVPIEDPASGPRTPWISFTSLLAEIKDKVPPLLMELLNLHYTEFKNNMITRGAFVSKMRLIVGDRTLMSILKMFQQNPSCYPSEGVNDDSGDSGQDQNSKSN